MLIPAVVALAAASLTTAPAIAAESAATAHRGEVYRGQAVSIGKGIAQIVVRTDASGTPQSVAVMLTQGVLRGLPTVLNPKNAEGEWDYALPMPTDGPKTSYTHVVVDWNPHGHPPPHVYTVPHFDFHFYTMAPDAVAKVAFTGPKDPAASVSDATLIPPGYKVIPETAINKMGVHAVELGAPEFNGKPFTATFIYGYYRNELTFVEPMITHAFLKGKPHFAKAVATPAHYSVAGYYPTHYSVRYLPQWKSYLVSLDGLQRHPGIAPGSGRP
jgi:hypothetical protein